MGRDLGDWGPKYRTFLSKLRRLRNARSITETAKSTGIRECAGIAAIKAG